MNLKQAIELLEQGLNASAKNGTFNLKDSALLAQAIEVLKNELERQGQAKELSTLEKLADGESKPSKKK